VLVWVLSSVLITGFVAFALTTAYLRRRRLRGTMRFNMEEFITARSQVGMRLANTRRFRWQLEGLWHAWRD